MNRLLLAVCLCLLCAAPALAQTDDCPAFVEAALAASGDACTPLARSTACYGSTRVDAAPRADADVTFAAPGDTAALNALGTLTLAPLSLTDDTWGIALLAVQANLPDTVPGQNVVFALFGDVSLTNAVDPLVEVAMRATGAVNVRLRPSTNAAVVTSLTRGQDVTANGRLDDGAWVRVKVQIEGESRNYGWVSAQFLDGDVDGLPVVAGDAPLLTAGQAFYFTTGIGDSPCAQAPDSGILVQSPAGAGRVLFTANGVQFDVGSTLYLTAGGGVMTAYVVEGSARVTANDVTQGVPAGTFTAIPLDAAGQSPVGTPAFPVPYDAAPLGTLPLALLPQAMTVAAPLQPDAVQAAAAVSAAAVAPALQVQVTVSSSIGGACLVIGTDPTNILGSEIACLNAGDPFYRTGPKETVIFSLASPIDPGLPHDVIPVLLFDGRTGWTSHQYCAGDCG